MQQEITKTSVCENSDHVQASRIDFLFDRWPVASVYVCFLSSPSLSNLGLCIKIMSS